MEEVKLVMLMICLQYWEYQKRNITLNRYGGVTEVGTTQKDVVREGVVEIQYGKY